MKTPKTGASESAKALEAALQEGQLPPTATEQAIGGRKANPTPKPNPDDTEPEKPKTPKADKKEVKPRVETIFVRHDFEEGEFAEMAKKLGIQQREYLEIQAQLKSIRSEFKARTDKVEAEISRLTNAINDGYVMREVETITLVAIDKLDKSAKKCFYERQTGKFIKSEPVPLSGQLDIFAIHPKPTQFSKRLSEKVIRSAV